MTDRDQIPALIPHRHPFLWIDQIEEIEAGVRCVASKYVKPEEPFFAGHFPGRPVLPGVFLIEAVAQTAGVMLGSAFQAKPTEDPPLLAAVNRFKFLKAVPPGSKLRIETRLLTSFGRGFVVAGTIEVEGDTVAQGELSLVGS